MRRKLLSLLLIGALCAVSPVSADDTEEQIEFTADDYVDYTDDTGEGFEGEAELPDEDMEGDDGMLVISEDEVDYVDDGAADYSDENGSGDGSGTDSAASSSAESETSSTESGAADPEAEARAVRKAYIEEKLNLRNNADQEWTYSSEADAWVLSVTPAVAEPEIEDEEGVSVAVPGAYVVGIDTDGDGAPDATAAGVGDGGAVKGSLVIDYNVAVTSTSGQVYTALTAPVIINTGAAGYSEQQNQTASTACSAEGYINVACGNRGKQSTATDVNGAAYYTGDAPSCLVDQKNVVRFLRYNILLGNLPGSVDYFVSTGGSGGGAHAAMLAATSDHPDFYDYEIAVGAVGVYEDGNGGYTTTAAVDGLEIPISDGMWGCIAYSPITSLAEADLAMAFEYNLDTAYSFNTEFQKQLASYLSADYMELINSRILTVDEAAVGFDLDGDGAISGEVALTIEYDPENYPETNGYYGTYLTLYLNEFEANLQHYLDELDYAEGWTWFDENGAALSDEAVAAMTPDERKAAFIEGQYAKGSTGGKGGRGDFGGDFGGRGGFGGPDGGDFGGPDGAMSGAEGFGGPDGGDFGGPDGGNFGGPDGAMSGAEGFAGPDGGNFGGQMAGTPQQGTTQASNSSTDSANYASFEEMLAAYRTDIADIEAGDRYGKNIVDLYNPLRYIGAGGTNGPVWARLVSGAAEGDISMFNSLNLEIAWLNAGTDAVIEWQWDGGHVPSEILGDSFSLYVDEMYGRYVEGALAIEKPAAVAQTVNGTAESASGTDLSGWVDASDLSRVSFSLADAAAYRTAGASKATPGFDVIDYGQEDYVFGDAEQDARHWNRYLLNAFEEHAGDLAPLFSGAGADSGSVAEAVPGTADGAAADGGPAGSAPDGIEAHMEEQTLVG